MLKNMKELCSVHALLIENGIRVMYLTPTKVKVPTRYFDLVSSLLRDVDIEVVEIKMKGGENHG